MSVAILTDTNSGITVEAGKEMGIYVIPMPVIIDGRDYFEGVDITHAQLYQAMEEDREVSTSQPAPGALMEYWDQILAEGHDEILYIPMSSGLSTSCNTATMVAEDEYEGKVWVVDNHRISVTMEDSVRDAKVLAEKGMSAQQIKESLETHAYDSSIYISVDTLKYLKKGGRVTPAGAALAAIMNIKPVLTIQGGKLDSFTKARSMKQCRKKMLEAIKIDAQKRFGDLPAEQIRVGATGSFMNPEDEKVWQEEVKKAFPDYHVFWNPLSCSISVHVGMNAIGIGISRVEK